MPYIAQRTAPDGTVYEEEIPDPEPLPPSNYIPGSTYVPPVGVPVEAVAAGEPVPDPVVAENPPQTAAPIVEQGSSAPAVTGPPPAQAAPAPVASELYGGPVPEPAMQAYGNPDYVTTTYPASGAPVADIRSVSTGATAQASLAPVAAAPNPASEDYAIAQTHAQGPTPLPSYGSASTPSGSAMYGAGGVDAYNGGYPPAAGTRPVGFDPAPTTVPEPPPGPNTGGGASTYYGGADSAYRQGQGGPNATQIAVSHPAASARGGYNFAAAEPSLANRTLLMPETDPVIGPNVDLQPVETAIGNVLPNLAEQFGRFAGPILGMPGSGRRDLGGAARRVQDTVGGMVLPDPEKPVSAAGQAGRAAGRAIDAIVDPAAEGLAALGRDLARLSAGLPAGNPGKPMGGGPRSAQEPIPEPAPSIPGRLGGWLRDRGDEFAANSADNRVFGQEVNVHIPTPGSGARTTHTATRPNSSLDPETEAAWHDMETRSIEAMLATPENKAAFLGATEPGQITDSTGTPRQVIVLSGGATDAQGRPFVLGIVRGGVMVPIGKDGILDDATLATADVATTTSADAVTDPNAAATIAANTAPAGSGSTTASVPEWTGGSRSGGSRSGGSRSSGGGGGWNDDWSGGGSSSRRSGSWGDFEKSGFERDFTVDDFLDQAGGNRRKAERMAASANKRRRTKRGTSGTQRGGGMWPGFPFNRPPSPIRQNILTAIAESRAAGNTRR